MAVALNVAQLTVDATNGVANSTTPTTGLNIDMLNSTNVVGNGFAMQVQNLSSTPQNNPLVASLSGALDDMQDSYNKVRMSINNPDVVGDPSKMLELQMALDNFSLSAQFISKGIGMVTKDVDTLVHIQ